MSDNFEPREYWEKRLTENYDLHGVGLIEWGPYFNRWLYRIRRYGFLKHLGAEQDWNGKEVLDVGSGTGFYLECWQELGVENIHGMDLTEIAVQSLRIKYPKFPIYQGNIGDSEIEEKADYFDAISCMDVLFHIIDDQQYEQAIQHIYNMLKPGGYFVFSDSLLHGQRINCRHIVHRSLEEVQSVLKHAGFEKIHRSPMFVCMNAPDDSHNLLLRAWWWGLYQLIARSHIAGGVIGCLLYPIEKMLVSLMKESPSTEFLICRKP